VRERALAAGAHVFVTKDAPMDQILEALRPSRVLAPAAPTDAPLAVLPRGHRLRRASLIVAAALAAYVVLFFVFETAVGAAAAVLSVLPVVLVGVLLGPEGGLAAAVLTILATAVLWGITGHAVGEPIVEIGGQGFGIVMLLLLGFGAGAMRVLGLRLDPRGRRAEAIAQAARALSGLDRGEFIDVFLDAMLRVVPGDLALLYSNAAGDARFIAASRPIGEGGSDRMARLARDAMRSATARVIEEVAEGERPVSTLRSAALVPVSVAGQDVRGVLVVLHRERARYGPDDVSLIRPFAQYLWVVLRSGTPADAVASARERREAG
jgi:hypothetical protein